MQVQTNQHKEAFDDLERRFQGVEGRLNEDGKRFFKLFAESTREGSQAAAREMEKIAARQTKSNQKGMLFYSLSILMRTDSKKLRWPNSPLRIMLLFVDANERWADSLEELATGQTLLRHLSYEANNQDQSRLLSYEANNQDQSFHRNQVILGQQLFRHGANANLDAFLDGFTPLHIASYSSTVTNLDFIQLLLEKGANPNAQNIRGETPVMFAIPMAPGAAKFILEWCTPSTTDIDIHITSPAGTTLLDMVHSTIEKFFNASLLDNPDQPVNIFLLQQWSDVQKLLEERASQ
jgi:hypothetical protein